MSILSFLQAILLVALLSVAASAQETNRPGTEPGTDLNSIARSLPTDFPSDIPVYPGSTVIGAASSQLGLGASFSTIDDMANVSDYYWTELPYSGWVDVKRMAVGPAVSITASKGSRMLAVAVTKSPKGETIISVGAVTRPPTDETRFRRDCRAAEPFEVDPIAQDGAVTKPADLLALEEKHNSHSSDEALTKELAEATYTFGVRLLCQSAAAPDVKYPIALRLLRAALKLNPSHDGALDAVAEIDSECEEFGQPVPE